MSTQIRRFGLMLILAAGIAWGQGPGTDAVITFHFVRAGTILPSYTFTIHENGSGTYEATYPATSSSMEAQSAKEPLALTQATTAKLFEEVRSTHQFRNGCESKAKNIADTGMKTLTYAGPDGGSSCRWNFTEDKTVEALGETFAGMAFTLDMGRTLAMKRRFDRLGLDQQMNLLVEAAKSGRAVELSNIAPVLRSLAEDPSLMERVRMRAAKLLEQSGATH